MPLHIKDPAATEAVRRLAALRGVTLTDAVRAACEEALSRADKSRPARERLADIHAAIRSYPQTGRKADKAFYDKAWREE